MNRFVLILTAIILSLGLTACGGGGGGTPATLPLSIASFELLDPTPGAGEQFGSRILLLPNGNIVVSDPVDSSVVANGGAVHLYNPLSKTLIASIYGDVAGDRLGSSGIIALANSNFVVASSGDDEGGIVNAGSVRLVNGATGAQIGATLAGDNANDNIGSASVTALANNNFVVASQLDDEGGFVDAGTVRLVNGATGIQIGATLAGDKADDNIGSSSVTALANNNFVVASELDDNSFFLDVGSVWLVDGATGVQIGAPLMGGFHFDNFGSTSITPLANNNFVVASANDELFGELAVGSVLLVDGATGMQVGATLTGDVLNDRLGSSGVTALANNNFVVASSGNDEGGIVNAGSVQLVDGATGMQIGTTLAGDVLDDSLGLSGVTALANSNFVVASFLDDEGGLTDAGSVRLVDGTTGIQIGVTLAGDVAFDQLGLNSVTALSNNNFVVASATDDEGGNVNAGSVRLVNGTTGVQIGATLAGDMANDNLGGSSVTALANNNFVVASSADDEAGIGGAGTVRLVNGSTGIQINLLAGDLASDFLGNGGVIALANNNFVVASPADDEGGIVNAGSVRLVDGTTGVQIGASFLGSAAGSDLAGISVTGSATGDYYLISLPSADNGGLVDSGLVRLIKP